VVSRSKVMSKLVSAENKEDGKRVFNAVRKVLNLERILTNPLHPRKSCREERQNE